MTHLPKPPPPMPASSGAQGWRSDTRRWHAGLTTPRALTAMALLALAVLLLWLTIKVDLVIFAGVLFGICLRRAADGLSRFTRLPPGWSLLAAVVLIVAFFAGIWSAPLGVDSFRRRD